MSPKQHAWREVIQNGPSGENRDITSHVVLSLIFVSDCCAFSFETSTKRAKGAVVDIICATKALEKKHLFFSKSYLFL
jgi:hypothetical protein